MADSFLAVSTLDIIRFNKTLGIAGFGKTQFKFNALQNFRIITEVTDIGLADGFCAVITLDIIEFQQNLLAKQVLQTDQV